MTDDPSIDSTRELEALIAHRQPESDVLEFKEQVDNKQTARVLAALANHRGGRVVFGIREENSRAAEVTSIDLTDAAERIANIARDSVDEPLLLAETKPIYTEGNRGVLVVRVALSDRAPHFVNGQGFMRSGPLQPADG